MSTNVSHEAIATVDSSMTLGSIPDRGTDVVLAVTGSRSSVFRSAPVSYCDNDPTTGTVRLAARTAGITIAAVTVRRTLPSLQPSHRSLRPNDDIVDTGP